MQRSLTVGRASARAAVGFALATLLLACGADGGAGRGDAPAPVSGPASSPAAEIAAHYARMIGGGASAWYRRTPPADRVTWGGLAACALLGLGIVLERLVRVRRGRVVPRDFVARYLDRLREGKLDRGKALDFCELNPSPASRVALAAVRRWGRPVVDLERAVAMAQRVEADRLRRNVGTLRRVAALAPLIGLLGALFSAGRVLSALGAGATAASWGPALALALSPLTAGVALGILALVAYDGMMGRVEALAGTLDRLGAETVDAIAMATPVPAEPRPAASMASGSATGEVRAHPGAAMRSPHPIRVEIPDSLTRARGRGRDDDMD